MKEMPIKYIAAASFTFTYIQIVKNLKIVKNLLRSVN